jgi:hypothetical protein
MKVVNIKLQPGLTIGKTYDTGIIITSPGVSHVEPAPDGFKGTSIFQIVNNYGEKTFYPADSFIGIDFIRDKKLEEIGI